MYFSRLICGTGRPNSFSAANAASTMFGLPLTTEYDTRFHLLGIPVRINPFFWVMAAYLGWERRTLPEILVWIACVFV